MSVQNKMQIKKLSLIIYCFILLLLVSCSTQTKKEVTEEKIEIVEEKTSVIEEKVEPVNLASLSFDKKTEMISQTNALEGSFYYSGKSVTLWGDNSKAVLAMMFDEPPASLNTKNLVGHLMIMKKDEQSADVLAYIELYMAGADSYAVFKIDEQKYYQSFTEKGLKFFTKMTAEIVIENSINSTNK